MTINALGAEHHMSVLSPLKAASRSVNRVALYVCVACILAMLSISFTGFFYMIVTGEALSWTYSLARLFIPWIGMLSITVAFYHGEHVAMTMAESLLPPAVAVALRYLVLASIGMFAAMLLWFGWQFFADSTQYYMVSDQLQIHARWVAASVPTSGAILLLHMVNGLILTGAGASAMAAAEH